jgi:hypothetical protein
MSEQAGEQWPSTPLDRITRQLDAMAAHLVGGDWREQLSRLQACYPDLRAAAQREAELRQQVAQLREALKRIAFPDDHKLPRQDREWMVDEARLALADES